MKYAIVKIALLAPLAAFAAGCGGGGEDDKPRPLISCTSGEIAPGAPIVAVLAQSGDLEPALAAAREDTLATVVDGAAEMQAHVLVNGVAGGEDAPHLLVSTHMVEEGPNPLFRQKNLECKREAIAAAQKTLELEQAPAELDVFAALRVLKSDVEGLGDRRIEVVVLSSMLNRRRVDLGDPRLVDDPAVAINRLAREQLNFRCEGWRVYAVDDGGGDPRLRGFWRRYFEHCGGALVAYNTRLPEFPLEGGPIEAADTTTLPLRIERTPRRVAATVDSEVLFETGSARLRPAARTSLRRLTPLLRKTGGTIRVDGHTDSTGTDAVNLPLSEARARTVGDWLEANDPRGRRVRTDGHGASRPLASNSTPTGRARNRRVVITITR